MYRGSDWFNMVDWEKDEEGQVETETREAKTKTGEAITISDSEIGQWAVGILSHLTCNLSIGVGEDGKDGTLSTTWQLVKLALPLFLSSASWVRYACFLQSCYSYTNILNQKNKNGHW